MAQPVTGADDLIRLLTGERIGKAIEIERAAARQAARVHSGAGGTEEGGVTPFGVRQNDASQALPNRPRIAAP